MPNYTVEWVGSGVVITLQKDLTVYFNEDLSLEIKNLSAKGCTAFIFDLSQTEWIDSMGIGCIFSAGKQSVPSGRKAMVVGANEKVHYAISLLKLDRWIEFQPDLQTAKMALGL
jgi:anti-anti-sigma factor